MNKKLFFLLLLPILMIIPVYAQTDDYKIPSWIKLVAGAWYNDEINDDEYQNAMKFLIEEGVIKIDSVSYQSETNTNVSLAADNIVLLQEIETLREEKISLNKEIQKVNADRSFSEKRYMAQSLEMEEMEDGAPEMVEHYKNLFKNTENKKRELDEKYKIQIQKYEELEDNFKKYKRDIHLEIINKGFVDIGSTSYDAKAVQMLIDRIERMEATKSERQENQDKLISQYIIRYEESQDKLVKALEQRNEYYQETLELKKQIKELKMKIKNLV